MFFIILIIIYYLLCSIVITNIPDILIQHKYNRLSINLSYYLFLTVEEEYAKELYKNYNDSSVLEVNNHKNDYNNIVKQSNKKDFPLIKDDYSHELNNTHSSSNSKKIFYMFPVGADNDEDLIFGNFTGNKPQAEKGKQNIIYMPKIFIGFIS